MTEGGLIKIYIEKQNINKGEVAGAIGMPEDQLDTFFQSQTVEPDIKKKLQVLFDRNIFDGTLLMEYKDVPDQQSNRS